MTWIDTKVELAALELLRAIAGKVKNAELPVSEDQFMCLLGSSVRQTIRAYLASGMRIEDYIEMRMSQIHTEGGKND